MNKSLSIISGILLIVYLMWIAWEQHQLIEWQKEKILQLEREKLIRDFIDQSQENNYPLYNFKNQKIIL